jgi:hypothetical protein
MISLKHDFLAPQSNDDDDVFGELKQSLAEILEEKVTYFQTSTDAKSRGNLKFGDKCEQTKQCGFANSVCYQSYCTCSDDYASTNHVNLCGKGEKTLKAFVFLLNDCLKLQNEV